MMTTVVKIIVGCIFGFFGAMAQLAPSDVPWATTASMLLLYAISFFFLASAYRRIRQNGKTMETLEN